MAPSKKDNMSAAEQANRRSKASAVNKARRDVGDLVGYDQVPDAVRAQMDAALVAAIEPYYTTTSSSRVEGARTAGVNVAAAVAGRKLRFPDSLSGGPVSSHPTALKLTPTSACLVPPVLCFRKLIHKAFNEAHIDADNRRPLFLREWPHSSFQNCECPPLGTRVNIDEVRYICQVLEGRKETCLWIEPAPKNLNTQVPLHYWDDRRRVTWSVAVRGWDRGQLEETSAAYYAGNMRYHIPNVASSKFYGALLDHMLAAAPLPPPPSTTSFHRSLIVDVPRSGEGLVRAFNIASGSGGNWEGFFCGSFSSEHRPLPSGEHLEVNTTVRNVQWQPYQAAMRPRDVK
ncbi:hypothetical protein F5882DRAFT_384858 [Hyaloscypha sp. PMI_1271]|nr:hypothetical protein F5882DRAFT_384858 [Hyaloscypha sp. PMI_1271]